MTPTKFRAICDRHKRIAICGGPRVGKTYLSQFALPGVPVFHTDDTIGSVTWENVPQHWIDTVAALPRFVLEGIQTGRCLRKGLQVDAVILLETPYEPLTGGQQAMAKGCATIMREVLAGLPENIVVYR